MEKKNNRDKWLHVRLNNAEFERIQKHFERTTDRKISVYIRKIILGKPTSEASEISPLTTMVTELGLNIIGNNFILTGLKTRIAPYMTNS